VTHISRISLFRRFLCGAVILGVLLSALPKAALFGWPAASDCRPYGTLTYFGSPALVGTRLQAKIQGIVVAEGMVTSAGSYALEIPADNPLTTARDGWREDDRISIWVEDHEAKPDFIAFDDSRRIDLTVATNTLDVKRRTWGKIKA